MHVNNTDLRHRLLQPIRRQFPNHPILMVCLIRYLQQVSVHDIQIHSVLLIDLSLATDQSTNTVPPPGPTNGGLNPTATNDRDGAYPFLGCYPFSTQDSGSIIAEGEDMGLTVQKCATFCDHADYFAVQGGLLS